MDIARIEGSAGAWKPEEGVARKSAAPSRVRSRDKVEISPDAVQARASGQGIAKLAAAGQDIRAERVEEAREKVESGYYDNPETIEKVADKMVKGGFTG